MAEVLALDERAIAAADAPFLIAGEDVRARPELLEAPAVFVAFDKFRDGRGYSSARMLREAGYVGDIRAVGDVTVDQLVYLRRCGFSSVAPERPIDGQVAARALERFRDVYQGAAAGGVPAWQRRLG
jgi:uncharacterized protein (DUF934 family)